MATPAQPHILDTGLLARLQQVRSTLFRVVMVFLGASLLAYPFASYLLGLLAQPLGMKLVMYAPMEGIPGAHYRRFGDGFLSVGAVCPVHPWPHVARHGPVGLHDTTLHGGCRWAFPGGSKLLLLRCTARNPALFAELWRGEPGHRHCGEQVSLADARLVDDLRIYL